MVRWRRNWEGKQAAVLILSWLSTLFHAHVFVFLKQTHACSSIKVQMCFFPPLCFYPLSPPSSSCIPSLSLRLHPCRLSLRTHSFISLQHFRVDPSQRLLFIFMCVCVCVVVIVCIQYVHLWAGDDVMFREWLNILLRGGRPLVTVTVTSVAPASVCRSPTT